jgi:hypothetical protein
MKVYTIDEEKYEDLSEFLEMIVSCGKKFLKEMEHGEFGARKRHEDDWEDYDYKIKRGGRY